MHLIFYDVIFFLLYCFSFPIDAWFKIKNHLDLLRMGLFVRVGVVKFRFFFFVVHIVVVCHSYNVECLSHDHKDYQEYDLESCQLEIDRTLFLNFIMFEKMRYRFNVKLSILVSALL